MESGVSVHLHPGRHLGLVETLDGVNPRVFMVNVKLMASLAQGTKPVAYRSIVNIKDLTNDPSVQDGVSLMKSLITRTQFMEMKEAQTKRQRVFEHLRVTYKWEGEDLYMQAKMLSDIMPTPGVVYIQARARVDGQVDGLVEG